jgi:hypothetical protein
MPLTVGTDSYISVADADTYFSGVLYTDEWDAADGATKEKALRMATRRIDGLALIGRKADPAQTLEFPRQLYSDSRYAYWNQDALRNNSIFQPPSWVAQTEVPDAVLNAVCEEAVALIKGGADASKREELQRQGVTSFTLGKLSETFSGAPTGNKLLSTTAAQLMRQYTGGSRSVV